LLCISILALNEYATNSVTRHSAQADPRNHQNLVDDDNDRSDLPPANKRLRSQKNDDSGSQFNPGPSTSGGPTTHLATLNKFNVDTDFSRKNFEFYFPAFDIVLGEGITGNTLLGKIRHKGQQRWNLAAFKSVDTCKDMEGLLAGMQMEARVLAYLNQYGVVCAPKLLYAGLYNGVVYLLATEYVRGGKSVSCLSELDDEHVACFARARHELHMAGIYHNDLRSENVLFSKQQRLQCTIIDYGLARFIIQPRLLKPLNALCRKFSLPDDEEDDFEQVEPRFLTTRSHNSSNTSSGNRSSSGGSDLLVSSLVSTESA
jgi:predicted Ser/Thr protein kinase